jgi:hypothetical protein
MTTPLQALDRALRDGGDATEVLTRLGDQGFMVVNQQDLIDAATHVLSYMRGVTNPEATARTVISASLTGSIVQGMMRDD